MKNNLVKNSAFKLSSRFPRFHQNIIYERTLFSGCVLKSYISTNAHLDDLFLDFAVVVALNKLHRVTINFRSNESFLMETMRLCEGLINQLRLCDCLTDVQSGLLNRQTVTSGKRKLISRNNSSDLLHVIRSCDDTKSSDCFRYLRQSGQKLVTKVVDNGGGSV